MTSREGECGPGDRAGVDRVMMQQRGGDGAPHTKAEGLDETMKLILRLFMDGHLIYPKPHPKQVRGRVKESSDRLRRVRRGATAVAN